MSYTKTTWANGDTLSAQRFNHMEDGVSDRLSSSSVGIVYVSEDGLGSKLDKNYNEIVQMMNDYPIVFVKYGSTQVRGYVSRYYSESDYFVRVDMGAYNYMIFLSNSPTGTLKYDNFT